LNLLIRNIKGLVLAGEDPGDKICGHAMSKIPVLNNAFVYSSGGIISDYGTMEEMNGSYVSESDTILIDAKGRFLFPSFCDSHTHLVYGGSREGEFTDRINGLTYEQIAGRGGGILNSAKKLNEISEYELFLQSAERVKEIIAGGTGAVEIKSGYGLTTGSELKMLRVIKKIREEFPIEVKATFLGAHAIPEKFSGNREGYIDLIINEMIPAIARETLADYIDVFCDRGFFTNAETERILRAGKEHGLIPKIHANELDFSGGVQTGVKFNALSVDHLERSGPEEIDALRGSNTMPTLLPGSAFFLGLPDPPARLMIDSGLPVALASDFNPGSCPSGNMKLIVSLACIRLKMTPLEAITAATLNSAYAMGLSATHGSVTRGKVANFFITKPIPSIDFFPYAFGSDLIETIILNGRIIPRE